MSVALAAAAEAHVRTAFLYTASACAVAAPLPPVPSATAASDVPPGVETAATAAAAEAAAALPYGSLTVKRGGTTVRFRDGSAAPGGEGSAAAPLLLATLPGGSLMTAFPVADLAVETAVRKAGERAAKSVAPPPGDKKKDGGQKDGGKDEGEEEEEDEEDDAPAKPAMSAAEALKASGRACAADVLEAARGR